MAKYELTTETREWRGKTLYRIRALRDIPRHGVKAGDLGGWVENDWNLSQKGDCWIGDEAKVCGDAVVYGSAGVHGSAGVYGSAEVYGFAEVYDFAWVYGTARVHGSALVYGSAEVYGFAKIYDFAWVYGSAKVYGSAGVYGSADVYDSAWVYGSALVYGSARVYGYARVYDSAGVSQEAVICDKAKVYSNVIISYGRLGCDMFDDMENLIYCSLGVKPENGIYKFYKKVWKKEGRYFSDYDKDFEYKLGEWAEANRVDWDRAVSCGAGLHLTILEEVRYWCGDVILECEVRLEDIITCLSNKVRVKKCKPIKVVE